jgi:hypothetical protein
VLVDSQDFIRKNLRLGVRLGIRVLLRLDLAADYKLADVVRLVQVEEPADFGSTLGTKALGENGLSQSRQRRIPLLDDDQGEYSDVRADNAAAHGLALALTSSAWAIARVAICEEKTDTVWEENTLLHGETLLVVAAGDAEDISLKLVSNGVGGDLLRDTLLVEDTAEVHLALESYRNRCCSLAPLLVEVDCLLLSSRGVWYVER